MRSFAIMYFIFANTMMLSLWFNDENGFERYQNALMCLIVSGVFFIYSELKGRKQ